MTWWTPYQLEAAVHWLAWLALFVAVAVDVVVCQVRAWRRYPWPAWARRRRGTD